jgi:HK97 family phage prohead protease
MIDFVSSRRFKMLAKKRRAAGLVRSAPLVGIVKTTVDAVEKVDDRTLRFTISTACVDRDLDCISVEGWQLDNFAKNPVVLWAHRADEEPIGKAIDFGRDNNRLFSAVRFLPAEGYGRASDRAESIYALARDGYLSATSVGFRPVKWDFTSDAERGGDEWFPGIDFHEQELVELSLVSVPSNPEALIEPGDDLGNEPPILTPGPAQLLEFDARDRRRRRACAALLGML